MDSVQTNLKQIVDRIRQAEQRYGRTPGCVQLLAVSKTFPAGHIRAAMAAGQRAFGESYLQEALEKILTLTEPRPEWHFIGPIQSNKTRKIAENLDWVHTIERIKIAQRLSDQRPPSFPPLNICLQVNTSGEQSKAGVSLEDLPPLAAAVAALPRLRLRGLMTIPAPCDDLEQQRIPFRLLHEAFTALNRDGYGLDTLSMGMSSDMEAAIAEGSTLVRIGTALFGNRTP